MNLDSEEENADEEEDEDEDEEEEALHSHEPTKDDLEFMLKLSTCIFLPHKNVQHEIMKYLSLNNIDIDLRHSVLPLMMLKTDFNYEKWIHKSFSHTTLFEALRKKLKLNKSDLQGLIKMLLEQYDDPDVDDFLHTVLRINKVKLNHHKMEKLVEKMKELFKIFNSKDSIHLCQAMNHLGMHDIKEFMLIGKGLLDVEFADKVMVVD